jgi:hypothetical protein
MTNTERRALQTKARESRKGRLFLRRGENRHERRKGYKGAEALKHRRMTARAKRRTP